MKNTCYGKVTHGFQKNLAPKLIFKNKLVLFLLLKYILRKQHLTKFTLISTIKPKSLQLLNRFKQKNIIKTPRITKSRWSLLKLNDNTVPKLFNL